VSFDELVCASCGGRVAEGRCATCRTSRAIQREANLAALRTTLLQILVALAVLIGALAYAVERTG
jgi:hypothetical protein